MSEEHCSVNKKKVNEQGDGISDESNTYYIENKCKFVLVLQGNYKLRN